MAAFCSSCHSLKSIRIWTLLPLTWNLLPPLEVTSGGRYRCKVRFVCGAPNLWLWFSYSLQPILVLPFIFTSFSILYLTFQDHRRQTSTQTKLGQTPMPSRKKLNSRIRNNSLPELHASPWTVCKLTGQTDTIPKNKSIQSVVCRLAAQMLSDLTNLNETCKLHIAYVLLMGCICYTSTTCPCLPNKPIVVCLSWNISSLHQVQ